MTMRENNQAPDLPYGMAYVPMQEPSKRYSAGVALERGTLYPDLDFPFKDYAIRSELSATPYNEIIQQGFVNHDLGLYLDTHPCDEKALEYYNESAANYNKLNNDYLASTGRVLRKDAGAGDGNSWVYDPWPWE
jgi:spore coat protein JB